MDLAAPKSTQAVKLTFAQRVAAMLGSDANGALAGASQGGMAAAVAAGTPHRPAHAAAERPPMQRQQQPEKLAYRHEVTQSQLRELSDGKAGRAREASLHVDDVDARGGGALPDMPPLRRHAFDGGGGAYADEDGGRSAPPAVPCGGLSLSALDSGVADDESLRALAMAIAQAVGERLQRADALRIERLERAFQEVASSVRAVSDRVHTLAQKRADIELSDNAAAEAAAAQASTAADSLLECERRHAAVATRLERGERDAGRQHAERLQSLTERDSALTHVLEAHRVAAQTAMAGATAMQQQLQGGLFLRDSSALCDMVDIVVQRLSARHRVSVVSGAPPAEGPAPPVPDGTPDPTSAATARAVTEVQPMQAAHDKSDAVGELALEESQSRQAGESDGEVAAGATPDDVAAATASDHGTSQAASVKADDSDEEEEDEMESVDLLGGAALSEEDLATLQRGADMALSQQARAERGRISGGKRADTAAHNSPTHSSPPPAAGVSTAPCSCLPPELPPQLPAEASLPGSLATVSDDGDDDVWDLSGLPEVGPAKAPADNPPHAAKAKRAAISLTMAMPGRSKGASGARKRVRFC